MSRLMAAIYDWFMRDAEQACLAGWRAELLADLRGEVLDVGAGTGANLAHYPEGVRVVLAEPDPHMRDKLAARPEVVASRFTVIDAPIERLPFADARFDAVVCTLVLCSVEDPARALAEIRRVLRPDGQLVFLEHVAAHDHGRRAWQGRIEPFWRRVAGNCHLTRETGETLRAAGFVVDDERRESMRKAVPWVRPSIRGVARRA
ncbi:MAG: class I SAM-dependent methyltransferase [Myxococcales bacterium]|nr:class I SAM-dependent methyltransferase [Myxococcales bacterium]